MAWGSIVVCLVLAGCGATSGSSSSGRPLECGPVVSSLFDRSKAFAQQVFAGQPYDPSKPIADVIAAIEPVFVESCREDHWSDELLACMDGMQVKDDPHKCNHLITNDQAVALTRRMLAVMQKVQQQMLDNAH
jgi:hypothetical protein